MVNWIGRAKKFYELDKTKQARLLFSVALVSVTTLCLKLFGFAILKRLVSFFNKNSRVSSEHIDDISLKEIVWSLELASKVVPDCDTCLIRALGMAIWLMGYGTRADIQIGVIPQPDNGILAHAWIVVPQRAVIWESKHHTYRELTRLSFT